MKIFNLEQKYGKELIGKILDGGYLGGCTIMIDKNESEDIPEEDIITAIRETKGERVGSFEWD